MSQAFPAEEPPAHARQVVGQMAAALAALVAVGFSRAEGLRLLAFLAARGNVPIKTEVFAQIVRGWWVAFLNEGFAPDEAVVLLEATLSDMMNEPPPPTPL